jgi:hypothetical protein
MRAVRIPHRVNAIMTGMAQLTKIGTGFDENWDFHRGRNGVILQSVGYKCSGILNCQKRRGHAIDYFGGPCGGHFSCVFLSTFSLFNGVRDMLLLNRKTRKSIGILSAGAAALLITGLGVANSRADTLVWNPSQSTTGGSNGAGTWNSSGTYWYDSTTSSGPVAWSSGSAATFGTGTGGSGTYTVTVGSSSGTYSTTSLGVSNSGNSYVLDGGGGTVTASGQMLVNGNLTLQNITLNNTAYTSNSSTTTGISQVALGAALNINSGATLNGTDINAGGINGTGVINVNSGGTLSESTRIQINYGPGTASGDEINVNSGSVTMSGGIAFLSDSALANSAGVMTVGADGTGGTVTVKQFGTGGSGSGVLLQSEME